MGVENSPDIFQQKMNNLFHGFEFIRAYTDKLLVLIKWDRIDHVHKLEFNINKQKEIWLKCDIEESFFEQT